MNKFEQYNTNEIREKDKAHFLHPWQSFDTFPKEGALPLVEAKGSYIYDSDGNRYLDAIGGMWCANIGFGNDDMADAISEQVRKLSYANPFVDLTNIPAAELASQLADLAPGDLNHVFYSSGGSTAVDTAFRLIHFYQNCRGKREKKHVISRDNSYHGSTYAAMSISGKNGNHIAEFDYITDTIHNISCPNYYRAPKGMSKAEFVDSLVKEFEDKIEELGGQDKVAAFFAEPIMGVGGVIVPPEGYLKRMWEVCKKNDILFVSDEVVTGFGRLGHWFSSWEMFGIMPDIITCAKGLTSGYLPLGATILSDGIWDVISKRGHGRYFAHGFTYSGHPVCCAAALKNIEIIDKTNILENVKKVGPYFEEQLKTLIDLDIVGDVRGSHFMMCVENVSNKETKELFPEDMNIGKTISIHAAARGLILRPVLHLNIMSPPLVFTKENVDFTVKILRESIEAIMTDLRERGVWKG